MKFRIKIKFAQSPSEVYQQMCSTNLMVKWETNFHGYQPTKGQKRKIKSEGFRIYNEPDGSQTKIKEYIIDNQRNKLLSYQLTHQNFMSFVECKFLDQGDGTVMIEDTEIKFRPAILGLIGLFLKGKMRRQREEDLNQFKQLLNSKMT